MPTEHRHDVPRRQPLLRGCIALCAALVVGSALAAPEPAKTESSGSAVQVAKADTKTHASKSKSKSKAKKAKPAAKPTAKAKELKPGPLADFKGATAPDDVVHVANWVSYTRNAGRKAFVIIDKKNARMYVFDQQGKLKSDSPVLVGLAKGDDSAPGVGNKPLSALKESEKTTPAGKFLAKPGKNMRNDDIIWIDYNAAVSMHRMHSVSASERRAERMATEDASDNRISNGCVNVPPAFYNSVLRPTVVKQGAYVYVLPETRTVQQQFGSYDVTKGAPAVADAPASAPAKKAKS